MKRLFFAIAVVIVMGLGTDISAQTDSFFSSNYKPLSEDAEENTVQFSTKNKAPLGSGALLMAAFGLIYLRMNKKNDKSVDI